MRYILRKSEDINLNLGTYITFNKTQFSMDYKFYSLAIKKWRPFLFLKANYLNYRSI